VIGTAQLRVKSGEIFFPYLGPWGALAASKEVYRPVSTSGDAAIAPRARGQRSRDCNRQRGRKEFAGQLGYPAMHEAHASLYAFHTRRFPSAFAGRKDGRRFCLRPVEAHDEVDRAVRGGEPVGFLVSTR
jgi:hypothetical protein